MRKKEDLLWKGVLEEVFDDFLRFVSPTEISDLDLEKGFEFLDKELEQVFPPEEDSHAIKIVDKLVKVFTKSGAEEWILVHIEVQGRYQVDFSKRMFTYFYRILDKYNRPITAYAIFTEAVLKKRSDTFEAAFMGTSVRYTFNTYKISSQSEQELSASNNPFASIVLIAKTAIKGLKIRNKKDRDEFLYVFKSNVARQLLVKELPKRKIRMLMNFLRFYVRFDNPHYNTTFDREVEILTDRNETMGVEEIILDLAKKEGIVIGIEKGIEQGIEKGTENTKREFIENLTARATFSDEEIASLANVSLEFIKEVRSKKNK